MGIEQLKYLFTFLIVLMAQVLILNHIHLFNCATPLLYVYLVLGFKRNYPRWATLLWCFSAGLIVDVFSNTPGVASSSMTFVGLIQPYIFQLFITRESAEDMRPTMRTMGTARYLYYSAFIVFIYCLLFFTVEMFSFFNWQQWAFSIIGSFLLTLILIIVIISVGKK